MKKQSGFTFLELVIVIGLVGVVAAFSISRSDVTANAQKLLGEARSAASLISNLVLTARSSQTSMKLTCASKSLTVAYYRASKSNQLGGAIGVNVATAIAGTPTQIQTPISYPSTSTINLSCAAGTGYVTSDGNLLWTNSTTYPTYDLTFTSSKSTVTLQTKVSFSSAGYPRIYIKDSATSATWTEVLL